MDSLIPIESSAPWPVFFAPEYEIIDAEPLDNVPHGGGGPRGSVLDAWLSHHFGPPDGKTTLLPGGDFHKCSPDEYIRIAREEVLPLVVSGPGQALAQALIGAPGAGRRLGIMLSTLHAHRGPGKPDQDLGMLLGDGFGRPMFIDDPIPSFDFRGMSFHSTWDPTACATPEFQELPQKGRSPKAYHHQFHPPADRSEKPPSEATRAAARKKRKKR